MITCCWSLYYSCQYPQFYYFTRPVVKKYFNSTRVKTNYAAVIGKEALVINTIDNINATGLAVVDGQEWTARSVDGTVIEGTK